MWADAESADTKGQSHLADITQMAILFEETSLER